MCKTPPPPPENRAVYDNVEKYGRAGQATDDNMAPARCMLIPTARNLLPWRYKPLRVCILQPSSVAIASSRTRYLDHTQRRATVGRTPLDK